MSEDDGGFGSDGSDGGFGFSDAGFAGASSASQPCEADEWITGELEPRGELTESLEYSSGTPLRSGFESDRRRQADFIRHHVFSFGQLAARAEEYVLRFYTGGCEWIVGDRDAAILVLLRYKWNTEKILNLASDNRDLVLIEAGVSPDPEMAHPSDSAEGDSQCQICWEDEIGRASCRE